MYIDIKTYLSQASWYPYLLNNLMVAPANVSSKYSLVLTYGSIPYPFFVTNSIQLRLNGSSKD